MTDRPTPDQAFARLVEMRAELTYNNQGDRWYCSVRPGARWPAITSSGNDPLTCVGDVYRKWLAAGAEPNRALSPDELAEVRAECDRRDRWREIGEAIEAGKGGENG